MRILCLAAAAAFVLTTAVWATNDDGNKDDETAQAMSKITQAGPGVYAIRTDNKGRITSCIVVGQSRISTVLGTPKGLEVARERAGLDASSQFVTWLKKKVSVHVKTDDQVTLFQEGTEGKDNALQESGKAVESTGKTMDSVAEGLVRGLQVLHLEVNAKEKTYTIVLGWDAKTAAATNDVEKANEFGKPDGDSKGPDVGKLDKKIEGKTVTADDAKKFLPPH